MTSFPIGRAAAAACCFAHTPTPRTFLALMLSLMVASVLATRSVPAHAADAELQPTIAPSPMGRPVAAQALTRARGTGGLAPEVRVDVQQDGSVQNTSVTNANTGRNTIAGGSLANAAGLPTVIQNTGNNVVIQNSTVVNVRLN